jgi:inosine-uridine nucleoside N-ribohydrolase
MALFLVAYKQHTHIAGSDQTRSPNTQTRTTPYVFSTTRHLRSAAVNVQVELLALGPLTNIALAVKLDRSFASKVKHLTIMGGCDKVMLYVDCCIFCIFSTKSNTIGGHAILSIII